MGLELELRGFELPEASALPLKALPFCPGHPLSRKGSGTSSERLLQTSYMFLGVDSFPILFNLRSLQKPVIALVRRFSRKKDPWKE